VHAATVPQALYKSTGSYRNPVKHRKIS